MLRSILIGLDGSPDGDSAVELGLSWAKAHDALAIGASIVDESGILVSEQAMFASGYRRPVAEPLLDVAQNRSRAILEEFSGRCRGRGVRSRALGESGTPFVRLVDEAQRCDLVVLGQKTHYEYGWKDRADETLSRVLRDSPRPVVAVPTGPISGNDALVAYDGSLQAARALYAFEASGLARSMNVYVVSIATSRAEARRHSTRAVEFLANHDVRAVDLPIETEGKPAATILEEVDRRDTGLLVMGAYGQPTLREFFIGSVTRAILDGSPAPIFCYH